MEPTRPARKLMRIGKRGSDETAPAVLLGGVTLVVGIVVGVIIVAAVLVWALMN